MSLEFFFCVKDWANPLVCGHIRRYPVIPKDGIISEVYHAQKWRKEINRHILSPMYDAGSRHYYIDELARLKNGRLIIPVRWLEDNDGEVFADAYAVHLNDQVRGYFLGIMMNPDKHIVYRQCR